MLRQKIQSKHRLAEHGRNQPVGQSESRSGQNRQGRDRRPQAQVNSRLPYHQRACPVVEIGGRHLVHLAPKGAVQQPHHRKPPIDRSREEHCILRPSGRFADGQFRVPLRVLSEAMVRHVKRPVPAIGQQHDESGHLPDHMVHPAGSKAGAVSCLMQRTKQENHDDALNERRRPIPEPWRTCRHRDRYRQNPEMRRKSHQTRPIPTSLKNRSRSVVQGRLRSTGLRDWTWGPRGGRIRR